MIAIVYPEFYSVSGIPRYLDSFLSNLPVGHPLIYLICSDEHQVERSYTGVKIIHISSGPSRINLFLWSLKARKLLIQLYGEGKIQWVNLHFPPLIPGLFLPRHIPIVLTAHTTYLGMSGRFYDTRHFKSQWNWASLLIKSWMEQRIFNITSKVIALTEQGRQEVMAYGFKGAVDVIPNGADIKLFNPEPSIDKDIDVLFCGRIEFRKGSKGMVELCHKLISDKGDVRICIVGYGDDEPWVIESLAKYQNNVVLTGKVQFTEMIDFYKRSRIYVSTSYYEGLPGTCLEAMAMELPSVVWDFMFYRGLVKEGETGALIAPNEYAAMSEKIIMLLHNPQLAAEMGRNARVLLENEYDWKKLAIDVLKVFVWPSDMK